MKKHHKDIKRFSFSRFRAFHTCPRQHYYQYVEQIETPDSPVTTPGKIFHEAVAAVLEGKDTTPMIAEFKKLCMNGTLDLEPDTMEFILQEYFSYYKDEFAKEKLLLVEHNMQEDLEDGDYMVTVADQVFEKDGLTYLRDIKTTVNRIKYNQDDVQLNQQLLLYVPYVEAEIKNKIDAIEIDEVKIAKLDPVPVNNNGKPSADKRRLTNVTFESYYEYLEGMGLEDDKYYQDVLKWMEDRGHPLFNRVTHQILDINPIDTNLDDMYRTYHAAKNPENTYRVRGPLCNYCAFKELCDLDMYNPNEVDRNAIIDKIKMGPPKDD